MYAKIENNLVIEYPITNIKTRLPDISFPENINESHLPENFYVVYQKPIPSYDPNTHKLVQHGLILEDGKWSSGYDVIPLDEAELLNVYNTKVSNIRAERNQLLKDSDWTQTLDAPVDREAWAEYRQNLRNITNQNGFPFIIEWPVAPNLIKE